MATSAQAHADGSSPATTTHAKNAETSAPKLTTSTTHAARTTTPKKTCNYSAPHATNAKPGAKQLQDTDVDSTPGCTPENATPDFYRQNQLNKNKSKGWGITPGHGGAEAPKVKALALCTGLELSM